MSAGAFRPSRIGQRRKPGHYRREQIGVRAVWPATHPFSEPDIMNNQPLKPEDFNTPSILISGTVDYAMYNNFRSQLDAVSEQGLVIVELSTLGGDPEVARMMGEDIRFHSDMSPDRRFVFLGKAAIYSAGTTFMSFFHRSNRYLTRGARLMIHERKMSKTLTIDGPLTTCIATVKATLHEIESSIDIQNEGFENLIRGSSVTMDEVLEKAPSNWYIEAQEAKSLGLIEDVL
jgi:ATP-dependent protease ClpP protease subunit